MTYNRTAQDTTVHQQRSTIPAKDQHGAVVSQYWSPIFIFFSSSLGSRLLRSGDPEKETLRVYGMARIQHSHYLFPWFLSSVWARLRSTSKDIGSASSVAAMPGPFTVTFGNAVSICGVND